MTRVLVVSGTITGVGKTVVTAAIAALAIARGDRVAVVKPAQTGTAAGEIPDTETVRRLTGLADTHELARFPDPLSPEAAARAAGLAAALDAPVVVVAEAALGTLNHTALTLEALAARKLAPAGVVIGSWPRRPGIAELANLTDLRAVAGGPLAGVMPEGAGGLDRAGFLAAATAGLAAGLGGSRPDH